MKKNKKENAILVKKDIAITSAAIKDDFCHYSFEILQGVGAGDSHAVKGKGIIENDMKRAFQKFNVHLAVIDDVFKHSGTEIKSINKFQNHELTALYSVDGFKIKGDQDNESIILIGTKYVNSGGHISIETPKIHLDSNSSYMWYNELKEAADKARIEVELYKDGKYIEVEEEEDPKQLKLIPATETSNITDDLAAAKV